MKTMDKVLSCSTQTQNLLQDIDLTEYIDFNWTALLKKSINDLSRQRPESQSVGNIVGKIADLDNTAITSAAMLYRYFSPTLPDMPPLQLLIMMMIACKSDAPLRAIAETLGLRLVKQDDALGYRNDEVVQ